jgi:hypothetical protein
VPTPRTPEKNRYFNRPFTKRSAFEKLGKEVWGGWEYHCDGATPQGPCKVSVVVPRAWSKTGHKMSGWLVLFKLADDTPEDELDTSKWRVDQEIILKFCPRCVLVAVRGLTNP